MGTVMRPNPYCVVIVSHPCLPPPSPAPSSLPLSLRSYLSQPHSSALQFVLYEECNYFAFFSSLLIFFFLLTFWHQHSTESGVVRADRRWEKRRGEAGRKGSVHGLNSH